MTKWCCGLIACLVMLNTLAVTAGEIKHKFYIMTDSGHMLHYIDQFNPKNNWQLNKKLGMKQWDMQIIDDKTVMVSHLKGWEMYDLKTRNKKSSFNYPKAKNIMSVRALPDGTKFAVANTRKKITVYKFSPDDKLLAEKSYKHLACRDIRLHGTKTALFAHKTGLTEISQDTLEIVNEIEDPERFAKAFCADRAANGNYLLGSGSGGAFFELTSEGKVVKEFKMANLPEGLVNNFYAGFQVLKNGNVVCAHWTGHKAVKTALGYQLVEYDTKGEVVWHFHDPKNVGTAVNVIVIK